MSFTSYQTASGANAHRLYRLSSSGASQSFTELSGVSTYVNGMDFASDGQLYGVGIVSGSNRAIVRIDKSTGVTALVAPLTVWPDHDIDIDTSSNVLRGVKDGKLLKINLTTGVLLSSTPIPGFQEAYSNSPIVFIP